MRETLRTSCGLLILVEQAAEAVASVDLVSRGWCATGEWSQGSSLTEAAVWPVVVVVVLPFGEAFVEELGVVDDLAVEEGVELFGVDAV